MTIYTRVSPKLSRWLKTKNVTDEEWLLWLLRECPRDLTPVADELFEAFSAAEANSSPVLEVERYSFDDSDKVNALIETRHLHMTSRPKHYATSNLISRFVSKWFEMLDKERASDPYESQPPS